MTIVTPGSVTVLIAYRAQPGHAERARAELQALIETVVASEPDCGGIRLLQDLSAPERILLVEQWTSAEAYTGPHMRTPHIQAFIARAPGFIAGPPEITIYREAGAAQRGS
jgi:quinol monooxygenase YgiN